MIFWDQLHFGGRAFAGSVSVTLGAVCVALPLVEPAITIALGAWILDESLHPRALAGGAVILVSVVLTMKRTPRDEVRS